MAVCWAFCPQEQLSLLPSAPGGSIAMLSGPTAGKGEGGEGGELLERGVGFPEITSHLGNQGGCSEG